MRWRLSGRGWQVVPSLEQLLVQVDAAYPTKHPSDGTLGNLSHSNRTSDHNPDDDGDVRAGDIGEVVENDAFDVAEAIRLSRDSRIKYVIHEKRMYSWYNHSNGPAWEWRLYTGSNGHIDHVHFSVLASNQDNTSPWDIGDGQGGVMAAMQVIDIQKGLNEAEVTDEAGNPLDEDDVWGPKSAQALAKGFKSGAWVDHEHTGTVVVT